ncbi:putative metallopeptidase [uncultured Methylobacterium sp.]|jgi:hypothetical protein|uniref:putative metallopeptidase n=1 Tax=uncultured Methylobacterium sp. TaxID=157278 RepID=UPI0026267378|nr:putative metallopeptidase [uncultured Methylobacterium sp.]
MLVRPRPPADLLGADGLVTLTPFRPAHDLAEWLRATFIDEDGPLANEDHSHLEDAFLGCLWCANGRSSKGNVVVGQAERQALQGNAWTKARQEQQLVEWFGRVPDFILTFHADYAEQADDAAFCALIEHELYHCGQERDPYGAPKFRKDGSPALCIRGHDVEEFVGVVRRYGAGSAAGQTQALVEAANAGPTIAAADIAGCCGTCGRGIGP